MCSPTWNFPRNLLSKWCFHNAKRATLSDYLDELNYGIIVVLGRQPKSGEGTPLKRTKEQGTRDGALL